MSNDLFVEWTAYFKVKADFERFVQKRREKGLLVDGFFEVG